MQLTKCLTPMLRAVACVTLLVTLPLDARALSFNISSTGNANADAGFAAAGAYWSSIFSDPVTININAGFSNLGAGILGSAGSFAGNVSYTDFRNAMIGDATSASDATMVANLPTGPSFSMYINRTSDNPSGAGSPIQYNDNDGGANNTEVRINVATLRALGLYVAVDAQTDVNISFNSTFAWDFDPSDGVGAGLQDFVGVAIHEIGHTLGFTSGVDGLDGNPGLAENAFRATPNDFTRFSLASENAGADMDFTADNRQKYFSIDGGATAAIAGIDHFSRGRNFGDGQQASHWRDNLGIGIMDPTALPAGNVNVVSANDILMFDVVGWDLMMAVPEPSTAIPLMALVIAIGIRRKRRQAS